MKREDGLQVNDKCHDNKVPKCDKYVNLENHLFETQIYDFIEETNSILLDNFSNLSGNSYSYCLTNKEVKSEINKSIKYSPRIKASTFQTDSCNIPGEKSRNDFIKIVNEEEIQNNRKENDSENKKNENLSKNIMRKEINKYLQLCKSKRQCINDTKNINCLLV